MPDDLSLTYYWCRGWHESEWERPDGEIEIFRSPYTDIRERPTPGTNEGSFSIGETHDDDLAQRIVDGLNALRIGAA